MLMKVLQCQDQNSTIIDVCDIPRPKVIDPLVSARKTIWPCDMDNIVNTVVCFTACSTCHSTSIGPLIPKNKMSHDT